MSYADNGHIASRRVGQYKDYDITSVKLFLGLGTPIARICEITGYSSRHVQRIKRGMEWSA